MTDTFAYSITFGGALAAALGLTPLAIRLARTAGIVDLPNARKVHASPTPRTGGLAIAGAAALAAAVGLALTGAAKPGGAAFWTLAAAAAFVLFVGLADDVFNVASQWKLMALLAAAAALCSAGVRIDHLPLPGGGAAALGWGAWPVTMLWVVAVTVAFNFIDGLDGLAAGLAAIACGTLAVVAVAGGHAGQAVMALALLGALGGFLVFNYQPAKLFMGDSGSMFLGFAVAGLSVRTSNTVGVTGGLLLPALVLAVPLIDTGLTFVRRGVLQRRSIFAAERGHIHHRLIDLGLCTRHAVLVLYAAAGLAAVVGLAGYFGGRWTLVGGVSFLAIVLAGLFRVAGSVRARETVAAVRRNRALGRVDARYRRAFEESQLRFRRAETFGTWWDEVGAAADQLDCVGVTLPITGRDGTGRVLRWRQTDSRFGGVQTLRATLPVRHRRVGGPLLANLEVPVHTTLECAGKRLALFARLMCEHSVAALPERPETTARPDPRSPADAFAPEPDPVEAWDRAADGSGRDGRSHAARTDRAGPDAAPDDDAELDNAALAEALAGVRDLELDGDVLAGAANGTDGHAAAAAAVVPAVPRVAVVHDFLYTYAGAEKVLEQILNVYPDADLFSLFDFLPADQRGFIKNKPVTTSFIQRLPRARQKHRAYLPLMPLAIEQLDVSPYDIVISSSYVAAKGVLTRPGQLHVCYCHSPVRFAWDLQHQYLAEANVRGLKSLLARGILHYIRNWDARSAAGVDVFVTNSRFVAGRVEKYYRRTAETIYPPVDVDKFTVGTEREDYYLTASRMVPYKRIDLIVEAFAAMPDKRLIVVGEGPDHEKIKAKAGPNVRLVGRVSDEKLTGYMQRARAFVFAAEEDFGIVPVEAMACGTPVIAFGRGGVTESVVDGRTGVFFGEQTVESLSAAVRRSEAIDWDAAAIRARAERFAPRRFRAQIRRLVAAEWAAAHARAAPIAWADDPDDAGRGGVHPPSAGTADRRPEAAPTAAGAADARTPEPSTY